MLSSPRTMALTVATFVAGTGLLTTSAQAVPPGPEVTAVFVDQLPCQSDPGPFEITLVTHDRLHERQSAERYHENSHSSGSFTAVPVVVDEQTGAVTPRFGPVWTGRLMILHTANDAATGGGHAVSTFRLLISATSDSGQRLHQQELAHYTGTARPDDDSATVRRFFATSTCR